MAVRLDDWTLSGISGAVDWVVMEHPAAFSLTHSLDSLQTDNLEVTQTYPGLYTELTPTVLTGHSTASADGVPLVYATVSSLVDLAKVGPQQLRLRQERYGLPGAYRLLYLTLPSEAVCDEWWRALHRLTYCNHHAHPQHSTGTFDDTAAAAAGTGLDAPLPARVIAPPPPLLPATSDNTSDVAELRRLLLYSPSSAAKTPVSRPSFSLHSDAGAGVPRSSALMPAAQATQQVPLRRSAIPAVAVLPPSDRVLARDAAASTAAISVPTSSQTELRRAASAHGPSFVPHRSEVPAAVHRDPFRAAAVHLTPPPAPLAAAARTSLPPSLHVEVPRHGESRSASERAWRAVAPPSPHALLDVYGAPKPAPLDTTALTRSSPVPVPAATAGSAACPPPHKERCSRGEATRQPRSTRRRRRHKKSPTQPPTANAAADTPAAGKAAVVATTQDDSLTDPFASRPAAAAAATPAPVVAASPVPVPALPAVYEPIHNELTSVPRARSASRSTSLVSPVRVHSLRWYSGGACASRTPCITYGTTASLSWRSPSPRDSRSWSAARLSAAPLQSAVRRLRGTSSRSPRHPRFATATTTASLRDRGGPAVSPLLSVIAKPHVFLKYTTQPPSLRASGSGGRAGAAGGDGVATYLFLTLDEDCLVTVPAAQFKQCLADAELLQHHSKLAANGGSGTNSGRSAATLSVGVSSFERARHFFGEDHCRGIRVADLERVSRGNEEALLLLSAAQRERFRDLSRIICIVGQTHAFLFEATHSAEAEWYVRQWKTYLRQRKGTPLAASVSRRPGHH